MTNINKDNVNQEHHNQGHLNREYKKVEVYSTARCPYCQLARQFLDKKGIQYTEFSIDRESHLREEMITRSGRTSVPQIFIGVEHVGGFEDMLELDVDGELDSLLGLTQGVSD